MPKRSELLEEIQKEEEEIKRLKKIVREKSINSLTPEEQEKLREAYKEEAEEEALEEENEEEITEETEPEPIDPDEQLRQQKKRILDKIEKEVDLDDFWREVLSFPEWKDVLRTYYRIVAGAVQNHYASFTVSAVVKNGFIEWTYRFFDADGKEIFYDAENEAGAKE